MNPYTALAMVYDALRPDNERTEWTAYIQQLLQQYSVPVGARLLDCACGTGEIAIHLAHQGYPMDAIDISEDMLTIAKEHAHQRGLHIRYACQDMRSFTAHRPYQAIICANDGVNYLTQLTDVTQFIRQCYAQLEPDGILIFDISTQSKLQAMDDEFYAEECDEFAYIWQNTYDTSNHTLSMDITLFCAVEDDLFQRLHEVHVQRGHHPDEIANIIGTNGFTLLAQYDAFSCNPPTPQSHRIHFIAKKSTPSG